MQRSYQAYFLYTLYILTRQNYGGSGLKFALYECQMFSPFKVTYALLLFQFNAASLRSLLPESDTSSQLKGVIKPISY